MPPFAQMDTEAVLTVDRPLINLVAIGKSPVTTPAWEAEGGPSRGSPDS